MCFSASASFTVAAGTGTVGVLSLMKASNWREIPLASIPLIFAVQQAIEGALWLLLPYNNSAKTIPVLANSFTFFALVTWPAVAPLAASLVEHDRARQMAMTALFFVGAPLAIFGLSYISVHPYDVSIANHSLSYSNGLRYPPLELGAYVICVSAPALLSSHTHLRMLGAIVATGLAISQILYSANVFSIWCFFAAAGSVVIYLHFAAKPAEAGRHRPA